MRSGKVNHLLVTTRLQHAHHSSIVPKGQQQSKGVRDFKISRFHWDFRIFMGFQDFTKISRFHKDFKISLGFHDFT